MKVPHYSNKKYWPLNIQSEAQREGKGERRREEEGGDQGGKRKREKGRELTLPNPSPFFPSPQFDTFPRYT